MEYYHSRSSTYRNAGFLIRLNGARRARAYWYNWKSCRRSQGYGNCRCGDIMVNPNNSFWLSTTQASVIRDTVDGEQITERSKIRGCHMDVQPQINVLLLLTVALTHLVILP